MAERGRPCAAAPAAAVAVLHPTFEPQSSPPLLRSSDTGMWCLTQHLASGERESAARGPNPCRLMGLPLVDCSAPPRPGSSGVLAPSPSAFRHPPAWSSALQARHHRMPRGAGRRGTCECRREHRVGDGQRLALLGPRGIPGRPAPAATGRAGRIPVHHYDGYPDVRATGSIPNAEMPMKHHGTGRPGVSRGACPDFPFLAQPLETPRTRIWTNERRAP